MAALVFVPELMKRALRGTDALSPLLLQWAGPGGELVREQIERAAAIVPEPLRPRVLGPLTLQSSDDQVRTAVGTLLLGKTLADLGWDVEHEPVVGTQTPDLLVRKGSAEYVVEVRRVLGRLGDGNRMFSLVLRALKDIRTATPFHLLDLQIDGGASLKPLVAHVRSVLAGPVPKGVRHCSSPGVSIAYQVDDSGAKGEPVLSAVIGWQKPSLAGDDSERMESAINQKLRAYKQPIIVALDLVEVLGECQAVRDAFYGPRPIIVPVDLTGQGGTGDAHLGPMQNGMLVGRSHNAQRARARLIALLPFAWGLAGSPAECNVWAQLLANPALDPPQAFSEFAPMPRFLCVERRGTDSALMQWEPPVNPKDWQHRPDRGSRETVRGPLTGR